jgi:DNA invertase Pin-like site-specific DNA recombinase
MSVLETLAHPAITTAHCAKMAYVYVRQSSVSQVTRHAESSDLQYWLVDRAVRLGWPRDRVLVIDDDLGKSGADSDERYGFQRLIAEIGLGHAGLVVSLDASRLARNNSDWHRLLELCGLLQTLIADSERIYDPRAYHDRLLLGLSGIMSEAELHHLKLRLHAGERNKALRGELRQPLPVGLVRVASGEEGSIQMRKCRHGLSWYSPRSPRLALRTPLCVTCAVTICRCHRGRCADRHHIKWLGIAQRAAW